MCSVYCTYTWILYLLWAEPLWAPRVPRTNHYWNECFPCADVGARSIKHEVERQVASQLALADERALLKRGACYRLVLEQAPATRAAPPSDPQSQPTAAPPQLRRIALMLVCDAKGRELLEPVFVSEHAKSLWDASLCSRTNRVHLLSLHCLF